MCVDEFVIGIMLYWGVVCYCWNWVENVGSGWKCVGCGDGSGVFVGRVFIV